jgi:hypothetical protein
MAFAHVKGVARDPKDYEVYQPKVVTREVIMEELDQKEISRELDKNDRGKEPEVKIKEKEIVKENPILNHPRVKEAIKHARRAGELK